MANKTTRYKDRIMLVDMSVTTCPHPTLHVLILSAIPPQSWPRPAFHVSPNPHMYYPPVMKVEELNRRMDDPRPMLVTGFTTCILS